ncbi:hypothetical protein LPJ75_006320, partial [Coemansia sp. RSA 2598]
EVFRLAKRSSSEMGGSLKSLVTVLSDSLLDPAPLFSDDTYMVERRLPGVVEDPCPWIPGRSLLSRRNGWLRLRKLEVFVGDMPA